MNSKHSTLISVDRLYKFKGKHLWDVNKGQKTYEHTFKLLPMFTINTNGGKNRLVYSQDWFCFIKSMEYDETEYFLFDLSTSDATLQLEVDNGGWDGCFENEDWLKICESLSYQTYHDFQKHRFPCSQYLLSEINYYSSVHPEYGEELDDVTYEIKGYLDNNFSLQEYDK